jgi:hypothetical protein
MANAVDVLDMLRPNAIWHMQGQNYEGITFIDCEALSKEEFEAGFAKYDTWKSEQDAAKATAKTAAQAKLAALGLTVEDLQALGL